jgi:hypothetical protein
MRRMMMPIEKNVTERAPNLARRREHARMVSIRKNAPPPVKLPIQLTRDTHQQPLQAPR